MHVAPPTNEAQGHQVSGQQRPELAPLGRGRPDPGLGQHLRDQLAQEPLPHQLAPWRHVTVQGMQARQERVGEGHKEAVE